MLSISFLLSCSINVLAVEEAINLSPETWVRYDIATGTETVVGTIDKTNHIQTNPIIPRCMSPQTIIGDDGREKINNVNTYPYSAVVSLDITRSDGAVTHGTGFMVAPNLVLTAGHNLYDNGPDNTGWIQSVVVKPGGPGSSFDSITATDIHSVTGWTEDADWDYDYGVIRLSTDIGDECGTLSISSLNNSSLLEENVTVVGFPGDISPRGMYSSGGIISALQTRKIYYNADTAAGQSGGPVWLNGSYSVVGIHTYGFTDSSSVQLNSATRITSNVISYVNGFD